MQTFRAKFHIKTQCNSSAAELQLIATNCNYFVISTSNYVLNLWSVSYTHRETCIRL